MKHASIISVTQAEAGQKLLQFIERRLGGAVPRAAIMRWIRKGQVRVDKGRKKPFDRVFLGQAVRIPPYYQDSAFDRPEPENLPLNAPTPLSIAYEREGLLAVAKPKGLAVHGGQGHTDSVVARLSAMFPKADFPPTLCHRLDRDTSGLLLVATTYECLRTMNDHFSAGTIQKLYLAWVAGTWPNGQIQDMTDVLEKQRPNGREKMVTGSGKAAHAQVLCLRSGEQQSLLAIRLLTGRTHQIRVQLASRGYPVVGDGKYGKPDSAGFKLHCYCMKLPEETLCLAPSWHGKWAVSDTEIHKGQKMLTL